ncbi:hypothetical protein B296_00016580 [Ensete ventricosum]|uniref:Uncharacterized protein n=1 Tax=Ensete ventricosum TaxID=4639 RepID=A0A427B5Y2_ENSVE|nr:hypothetical protein B296_00016580 [Ensete ventricosum]
MEVRPPNLRLCPRPRHWVGKPNHASVSGTEVETPNPHLLKVRVGHLDLHPQPKSWEVGKPDLSCYVRRGGRDTRPSLLQEVQRLGSLTSVVTQLMEVRTPNPH